MLQYKQQIRTEVFFMKHFISLVLAGVMTAVSVTFSSPTVTAETEHHDNVLITYFSRAGENYNVGVVERGNTDLLAEIVAEETGGELFCIETVKEYPTAYDEMLTIATEERTNKERPELKTSIENFDNYDVIFVGYPIWWGDMPMAMYTFFESYDWNGKTVIPFNTHEGSGQANTVTTIKGICEGADVMSGFSVRGSVAQNDGASARTIVQNWLDSNNFEALIRKQITHYTLQDIRNLQDFLLAKPTEEELRGKPYDLDGDGVWSVFDLCLMRQEYAENSTTDATSSATITADESAVLETYEKFEQAMIDKDMDTLNSLVAEDKTFTHMSGKTQTKEEFFGEIADGTLNYCSYKLNDPVVTVDGDTATLTGSTTPEAKVYGSYGTWTLTTDQKFVKLDGAWKLCD